MFFPGARLEAMYVRRLSEHLQYLVTAVNSPRVYNSPQVNKKKKEGTVIFFLTAANLMIRLPCNYNTM